MTVESAVERIGEFAFDPLEIAVIVA